MNIYIIRMSSALSWLNSNNRKHWIQWIWWLAVMTPTTLRLRKLWRSKPKLFRRLSKHPGTTTCRIDDDTNISDVAVRQSNLSLMSWLKASISFYQVCFIKNPCSQVQCTKFYGTKRGLVYSQTLGPIFEKNLLENFRLMAVPQKNAIQFWEMISNNKYNSDKNSWVSNYGLPFVGSIQTNRF